MCDRNVSLLLTRVISSVLTVSESGSAEPVQSVLECRWKSTLVVHEQIKLPKTPLAKQTTET